MMNLKLICFLFSLALAFDGEERDSTGCPSVFKAKCHCGMIRNYRYWRNQEEIYMVNCTNTRFTETAMLELLPPETEVLIFNGNSIPQLDWNLFGIWDNHENLEVVDLTNNNIREIPGKAFHKVKNVKRLILDHNDLTISGPNHHPRIFSNFYNLEELHLTNAFTETVDSKWYLSDLKDILIASNMTKLRKLHLEQNEIWEILDKDMFCGLKSLAELYLGDNQLQSVDFSLECLEQLTYLNLEYNKIKRLSDKTLGIFDRVFAKDPSKKRTINLKGNPFYCDCHLRNLYDWLRTTNTSLFHKEDMRCFDGYPIVNAGKQILNVQKLDCVPSAPAVHSTGTAITHALLIILIVLVIAVGVLVILYNRKKFHDKVKPLVVSFQKSMQYKTIDKEEEAPQEVNV